MSMENQGIYQAHRQDGILLNANESSENLSGRLIQEIQEMLPDVLFNRYPADGSPFLKEAYGRVIGFPVECLIAGNGSDQMLQLLITRFISEGDTLFTLTPDFGMYDFYVSAMHGTIQRYDLLEERRFDVDRFIEQAKASNPKLVLFSNPNNPTGIMISAKEVRRIAEALWPVPVAVDEAYMEFGEGSALDLLRDKKLSNLYVTRTLSKAYGLAGLRVGFLISNPENIAALDPYRPVYNLSTLSAMTAALVLSHASEFEEKIARTIKERERIQQALGSMEAVDFIPSSANFIFLSSSEKDPDLRKQKTAELADFFEQDGLTIRDYPGKDYLRITVGLPEENDRSLETLKRFNRKETDPDFRNGKDRV